MPGKVRKHRLLFKNIFPTSAEIAAAMEDETGRVEIMKWETELDVTCTPRVLGGCCGSDGQMRIVVIIVTYTEAD